MRRIPILLVSLALLGACAGRTPTRTAVQDPTVPPPLTLGGQSAYDLAGRVQLPEVAPGEYPGLHNVFRLSDSILSGAEPADPGALTQLADWGVRTVISVDGKAPDVATASSLGMRYVHVPIQYTGITEEEIAKLSKSFRELEGPFYVHCYHGRHRGPAAAALGRVVLDGLERDQAIAEMRQWCATSSKYEGLYATVATATFPTASESADFGYDFAPIHEVDGLRAVMVGAARSWDRVKEVQRNGWQVDPEHPDVDPVREVQLVQAHYLSFGSASRAQEWPAEYWEILSQGQAASDELVEALNDGDLEAADGAFRVLKSNCLDCHAGYRNQ